MRPPSDGCVLIGSGPSLAAVDMSALADVDSVAFNRSYVAWPRWGFAPTYYCCFDPIGVSEDAAELQSVLPAYPRTKAFLNAVAGQCGLTASEQITFVTVLEDTEFRVDGVTASDFGNVGASSLQMLAALGYRRVALVGVDGRYLPMTVPADARRNYFCDDYVADGRRMLSPDDETSRRQWDFAARGCQAVGVEVVNASPSSALECFPKMDLANALLWISGQNLGEGVLDGK